GALVKFFRQTSDNRIRGKLARQYRALPRWHFRLHRRGLHAGSSWSTSSVSKFCAGYFFRETGDTMKASKWMRRSSLTMLALLAALAGCESGSDSGLLLEPKHESEQILISWKFGNGYTVVRETEESVGAVEGVIGRAGGTLSLGKHLLLVPSGAVSRNTTFRMEKEDGDHVRIH